MPNSTIFKKAIGKRVQMAYLKIVELSLRKFSHMKHHAQMFAQDVVRSPELPLVSNAKSYAKARD